MRKSKTPPQAELHLEAVVKRWCDDYRLTPSEAAVLRFVLRGLSNKEVGRLLGTSVTTVRTQLSSILRKSGTHSRTELAFRAFCAAFDDATRDVATP
jgi:DNA-binding NarL/FixJ family response regulator